MASGSGDPAEAARMSEADAGFREARGDHRLERRRRPSENSRSTQQRFDSSS
jgi:hypothetical protein